MLAFMVAGAFALAGACGSGTGSSANGGSASGAGAGGGSGTGGDAGRGAAGGGGTAGAAGRGGSGGDAGGGSGSGGTSACAELIALPRPCVTDNDCVAIQYRSNCCGGSLWTGVPASTKQAAETLATQCAQSYPPCGCADISIRTDDHSLVAITVGAPMTYSAVGVGCFAGKCTTFAVTCGHPCTNQEGCWSQCGVCAANTGSTCSDGGV